MKLQRGVSKEKGFSTAGTWMSADGGWWFYQMISAIPDGNKRRGYWVIGGRENAKEKYTWLKTMGIEGLFNTRREAISAPEHALAESSVSP